MGYESLKTQEVIELITGSAIVFEMEIDCVLHTELSTRSVLMPACSIHNPQKVIPEINQSLPISFIVTHKLWTAGE